MDAVRKWSDRPHENQQAKDAGYPATQEEVWLLGQPSLKKHLDYVKEKSIGGAQLANSQIVDEWRAANDYYAELEVREAGFCEQASISKLDPILQPLADRVTADARWQRAFTDLPTTFAMVELDRLIVTQLFVNLNHTAGLTIRLGSSPSPQSLFEFCFPLDRSEAPVRMRRVGSSRFVFWSESSDFRFHEAALLDPGQIQGYEPFGALGGVIGLMTGYGSNFLSAIKADNRLVLNNGYDRAYALRSLGLTHAPCIVQTVTRGEELGLAGSKIVENPAFYFKSARPPVLKDFFDPKIRKVLQIPKMLRMVEVSFETKETDVIDFAIAG
jgi:hypothetical protein